jgi:hypothetical protein
MVSKEQDMELIERYLQAVKLALPQQQPSPRVC